VAFWIYYLRDQYRNPQLFVLVQREGSSPIFHFVSGSFVGRVMAIHNAVDNAGRVLEQAPQWASAGAGKWFTMTIMTKVPRTIERYATNRVFGRFLVVDNRYVSSNYSIN
jgi:hypothetical protein